MITRVYLGLDSHFAFRIGGESELDKLGNEHVLALGADLKVAPRYMAKLADEVAEAVAAAIPAAAGELEPLLSPSWQVMVERLQLKIRDIAGKMQACLTGTPSAADASDA